MVRMIGACEDCPSSTLTLEERERQSNEDRKEMEYLDNFNKELDRLIAEEKARAKSSCSVCWKQTPQYISSNR